MLFYHKKILSSSNSLASVLAQEMHQRTKSVKVEEIDDIAPNEPNNNDKNLEKIPKYSGLFLALMSLLHSTKKL